MLIRPYKPEDKKQVIALMSEFGEYLEQLDNMERTSFAENGSEYFTDKLINDTGKNNGAIFVATENDLLKGFIGGYIATQTEEELMESKKAVPGVVTEFFVTQKSRKEGIGSMLLTKMEDYFQKSGCTMIRLEVFAPNEMARNFYAKHGYQDRSVVVSKNI